ncbi:amidohydrolase family protein [Microbacterium sp. NEAU-LLC]|uniref:Amidohydrolase family protein n=1 Tax=Microbacterium helvum TaxID=2773713 RepID=A0ABR8NPU7_9MICO|nr:amidohydrolase family protein [Microbacterium helvum]MBD3942678.1 amidohydrolase family protein [Microbacterium helvum]
MIVDVHSHCHQPGHWGHEHEDHWQGAYGGDPYPVVTPESVDEVMGEAGIDVAIVFGLAASQAGVRTPNAFTADFIQRMKTPAIGFCALDPLDANWREQVEEAIELGMRGVKLYPVLSLFDPLDPEFDDFYRMLSANGMVALWHMGATPSPIGRLAVSQPLVIDEVARRHPDLTQVMAHMGHPWQRDTNVVLRKNRRVFADVSGVPSRQMDAYLALVNAQEWNTVPKLLFGSDYPLWTPAEAISRLRGIARLRAGDLPHVREETVESIIQQDALALLELEDPRA